MFVVLCSFPKVKTGSFFPPLICHATFHFDHVLHFIPSRVERGRAGYNRSNLSDRDTFDFSQCHGTKNQPMAVPV